jgi:glycosyltransferase involved in cell wall biosynthesis
MPKTLIFVSSHRQHKKVADRLLGAVAAGCKVKLFAFDRGDVPHPIYSHPNISRISLGGVRNGFAMSRFLSLGRAALILFRATRHVKDRNVILLANTLETLIISWIVGLTRLPTIYDVADINPLQTSKSVVGAVARATERRIINCVQVLVVSSPWFYWQYFASTLKIRQAAVFIENKVGFARVQRTGQKPLTNNIAWNGLLRCRTSAVVLLECMTSAPDSLRLSLHGSLGRIGDLGQKLLNQPNCVYTGRYDIDSLGELLAGASFVWAIDFSDFENSTWLLPNRLYEAIASGVPLIAVDGTATADVVRRYNIGIVLPECTRQAVIRALQSCSLAEYEAWVKNVDDLGARSVRGNEWIELFESDESWGNLKRLSRAVDVSVVLAA